MLLAVDIGNTNITMGVFKGERLVRRLDIPTSATQEYAKRLKALRARYPIDNAVVCSVVPLATSLLARAARAQKVRIRIVNQGIKIPVKNRYRHPRQVGQDRLVNAFAGIRLYGTPLIIVDFGTAITFDVISRAGDYLGGMIVPGVQISLDALAERTALLPRVLARPAQELIGRDTRASMLAGVVRGYAALTDGLISLLRRSTGASMTVATGGAARLIVPYCRFVKTVDPDLTLKGIELLTRRST
jgi:type III pantothenate kinase